MGGRDKFFNEKDSSNGLRNSTQYHSRIVRGQIGDVTEVNGSAQVDTVEILGTRNITVPPLWFSMSGSKSAWGRYMPMGNEQVHVAYRNDDTAVVLGYDANYSTSPNEAGWQAVSKAQKAGNVPGADIFKQLKKGEFDFKSSGDAYVYGSAGGTLFLAGGQAFIRLDKKAYRIESKASELHFSSELSELRFGTVFRKLLPTDAAESPVLAGQLKEFLIDINSGAAAVVSKAKIHFGDIVLDGVNIPELSDQSGLPLKGRISIGDPTSTRDVFSLEIDAAGNISIVQAIDAALGFSLTSSLMRFGSSLSNEPLVLGTQLMNALVDFIQNIFVVNAAAWGIGNMGAPVPLNPAVIAALNVWIATHITTLAFVSTKAFTEK